MHSILDNKITNRVIIAKFKKGAWKSDEKYVKLKWKQWIDLTSEMTTDNSASILKIQPDDSIPLHHNSPKELYTI